MRRPVVHKARPDADPHFEFVDDGLPEGQTKQAASKGRLQNKGMGLYRDHVTADDEDDASRGDAKHAIDHISTHIRNDNRSKDFGAHWEMNDDSPGINQPSNGNKLTQNQKKVLKTMDANWGPADDSPQNRGIKTAGNGMGARKGTESSWSLYDESPAQAKKENAGYKTLGNGMGGRKDTQSFWEF